MNNSQICGPLEVRFKYATKPAPNLLDFCHKSVLDYIRKDVMLQSDKGT